MTWISQIEQGERKPRFIEKPHKPGHKYPRGQFHTKTWLLNFHEIRQNAQRFESGRGDFTHLQEGFISSGIHFQCPSATYVVDKEDIVIRWEEWDKDPMSLRSHSISSENEG